MTCSKINAVLVRISCNLDSWCALLSVHIPNILHGYHRGQESYKNMIELPNPNQIHSESSKGPSGTCIHWILRGNEMIRNPGFIKGQCKY